MYSRTVARFSASSQRVATSSRMPCWIIVAGQDSVVEVINASGAYTGRVSSRASISGAREQASAADSAVPHAVTCCAPCARAYSMAEAALLGSETSMMVVPERFAAAATSGRQALSSAKADKPGLRDTAQRWRSFGCCGMNITAANSGSSCTSTP